MFEPKHILEYYDQIDLSLDKLSNHFESDLVNMPDWCMSYKKVIVGLSEDKKVVAIKVIPDESLNTSVLEERVLNTIDDVNNLLDTWKLHGYTLDKLKKTPFFMIGGMVVVPIDNPIEQPVFEDRPLIGYGSTESLVSTFTLEKAREEAVNFWSNSKHFKNQPGNYVQNVQGVIRKFRAIVRRKSFLERKIHRFINGHARILLPSNTAHYFEHKLYFYKEFRIADFILKREEGLPPILIELESPVHNILKKDMDLTAEANHARNQIIEWVQFIDRDSKTNANGEFSFLAGPKDKLVIIGKGLKNREQLENKRFGDTTFWTYDIFLENALDRLNDDIENQYKIVGMNAIRPFK